MKVLLLSRYGRLGASSRLRFYQYLPWLAGEGIEVVAAPFFGDAYLRGFYHDGAKSRAQTLAGYGRRLVDLGWARRFDLVWLEGEALPWLPDWAERWMRAAGIPYVVDYDDAIFHRYDQHRSPLVRMALGAKIDRVMRLARIVVAGSDYLAERAVAAGAGRVARIPTAIDLARYPAGQGGSGEALTVGWIGSRTTTEYLRPLRDILVSLASEWNLRVKLVGAGSREFDEPCFQYVDWSEDSEVAEVQGFDIGIMPLPDSPWERGKCGYKLIQYMGCHKPVIASPVGANRRIVTHGVNGFLAATPAEWRGALHALAQDRELRARLGRAGRALVESEYCTRVNAPKLAAVLREAVGC